MAEEVWGLRWSSVKDSFSRRYMQTAAEKKTLICFAADLQTVAAVRDTVESIIYRSETAWGYRRRLDT